MEDMAVSEDVQTPESKEVLLKVLQHAIFTWIIIEYYHSYSLLVLCIRAVQAVRLDSSIEAQSRHFFGEHLTAAFLTVFKIIDP